MSKDFEYRALKELRRIAEALEGMYAAAKKG